METKQIKDVAEKRIRKVIAELDLSFVALKLIIPKKFGGHGWSKNKIKKNLELYRGYLFVCWKYQSIPHAPVTPDMDEVWHTHILFTKEYTEAMNKIFGHYLHHTPMKPKISKKLENEAQKLGRNKS